MSWADEFRAAYLAMLRSASHGQITDAVDKICERVAGKPGLPHRDVREVIGEVREVSDMVPGWPPNWWEIVQRLWHRYCTARFAVDRRDTCEEAEHMFCFRQYLSVGNGRPGFRDVCGSCAKLHGLVFRSDDIFWEFHEPPWHDECRCSMMPLTEGSVRRGNLKVWGLADVRGKLGVVEGPTEFQPRNRTRESANERLRSDVSDLLFEIMLDEIDKPLIARMARAKDAGRARKVAACGVRGWESLSTRFYEDMLALGNKGATEPSWSMRYCGERISKRLEHWQTELSDFAEVPNAD